MAETTAKPAKAVGNKDADGSFKQYFASHATVADLLNNFVLDGGMHVSPEDIETLDSAKVYTGKDGVVVQRQVDVLDKAIVQTKDPENSTVYLISAIEAQSEVDFSMVVRCMGEAFLIYSWQIAELRRREYDLEVKEWKKLHPNDDDKNAEGKPVLRNYMKSTDTLIPVVNVVLYLGSGAWTGKTNLHDLLANNPMSDKISDFSIQVIAPHDLDLTDQALKNYTTDLGTVLLCLKNQNNKSALQSLAESDLVISADGVRLIEAVTGIHFPDDSTKNEGGETVSTGFAELLMDYGVASLRIEHELKKNTPVQEICTKYKVSPEFVEKVRKEMIALGE